MRICSLFTVALLLTCLMRQVYAEDVWFGQSAPFTGAIANIGKEYTNGILAAFHEVNTAGGVNNRTLRLFSMDDGYVVNTHVANMRAMINMSQIFAFVGTVGSPTTAAVLPIAAAAKYPIIGAFTGSAVFRKTFNPYTVHLRAGYDDEAMAMLRLFITEKQFRRVSVVYADDAFGAPATNAIIAAMKDMNLELASLHPYSRPNVANIDISALVQEVLSHRPQGLIMYTINSLHLPFYKELQRVAPYPILCIGGSWNGNAVRDFFKNEGLDPSLYFQTAVMPPPDSNLNISKQYRAAIIAREGLANATAAGWGYLGIEGYVVGRLVIEAMRRIPRLDREELLKVFYETRMFSLEEMLAGPYSRDCKYDPGTAETRSSMCYCNQGLRLLAATTLNANYSFVQAAPDVNFPLTECWAPKGVVVSPLVVATVRDASATSEFLASNTRIAAGMKANTDVTVIARDLPVVNDPTVNNESIAALNRVGDDTLLVAAMNSAQMEKGQSSYPLFETFREMPYLASAAFDAPTLHLLATLQQELNAHASLITQNFSSHPTFLVVEQSMSTMSVDGKMIRDFLSMSFETYDATFAGVLTFSSAAELSAQLAANPTANAIVLGIKTTAYMQSVIAHLTTSTSSRVFATFGDITLNWVTATDNNVAAAVRQRLFFATNIPSWTSTTSSFGAKYQAAMAAAELTAQISNPAYVTGYLVSRVLQFILVRTEGVATPAAVIATVYKTAVIALNDLILGPFANPPKCPEGAPDCRCSLGASTMYVTTVDGVVSGQSHAHTIDPARCGVDYVLKVVPKTDYTGVIVAAVLVPLVLIAVLAFVGRQVHRAGMVKNAPKDTNQYHSMFVSLKKETLLWERYPLSMSDVMNEYTRLVDAGCQKTNCYKVKAIGGSILITAVDAGSILNCAAYITKALEDTKWSQLTQKETADRGSTIIVRNTRGGGDSASERSTRSKQSSNHSRARGSKASYKPGESKHSDSASQSSAERHSRHLTIEFGVGVHHGPGRCIYDERVHAYDYSGPAVDGAAIASDRAQGGQLLVSSAVSTDTFDEECWMEYTTAAIGNKDLTLLQLNQPDRKVRTFELKAAESDNVDSIAAQLEQQASGATMKRVTVASIYLHGVEAAASSEARDVFVKNYTEKLKQFQQIIEAEKGYLHAAVGPRLIVSFNAAKPTPQALNRAYSVVEAIRELEANQENAHVTAGIASENAIVGTLMIGNWKHDALVGRVAENANRLQGLCGQYKGVNCLASSALHEELGLFCVEEFVDLIRFQDAKRVRGLVALRGMKASGDSDEWMYELDQAENTNPYFKVNRVYEALLDTGKEPDFNDFTSTVEELSGDNCGVAPLKKIAALALSHQSDANQETTVRDRAFEDYLSQQH